MKAVSCKEAKLELVDLPAPTPGRGQLLIDVLRCGICGSDLNARHNCDELADIAVEVGYDAMMRSEQEVILGHEFCGEIVEHGTGCRQFAHPVSSTRSSRTHRCSHGSSWSACVCTPTGFVRPWRSTRRSTCASC